MLLRQPCVLFRLRTIRHSQNELVTNRFEKNTLGSKISSSEALNSLQWIPLAGRRFAHRSSAIQNAIKGEIPDHLETFKIALRDLHGHDTKNSYLPRIPNPKTERGKRTTYL